MLKLTDSTSPGGQTVAAGRKSDPSMVFDLDDCTATITSSIYRAALDLTTESVLFLHVPSLRVVDANAAAARMMGVSNNWLCGRILTDLVCDLDRDRLTAAAEEAAQSGTQSPRFPLAIRNDEVAELPLEVIVRSLHPGCQDLVMAQFETSGLLDTRAAADSVRDPVTSLTSRATMQRLVSRAAQVSRPFAILFVDLNGFKKINDLLGHPTGDHVLHHVAQRMRRSLRPTESVGRWGGDEFLVLVEEYEREKDLVCIAQRICRSLESRFNVDGHEIQISASIGIAIAATRPVSVDALVRQADQAMYRAKNSHQAYCLAENV